MSATDALPVTQESVVNGTTERPAPKASKAPKPATATTPRLVPRVTRVVIRRVDPWTVLKLSLVYYLALFLVLLVAGVLLWAGASAAGVVGNIESFMEDIGFEGFRFIPSWILRGAALGGLVLVLAGTCANVLLASLFNLMTDIVGGLKLTLEEDVPKRGKDAGATHL